MSARLILGAVRHQRLRRPELPVQVPQSPNRPARARSRPTGLEEIVVTARPSRRTRADGPLWRLQAFSQTSIEKKIRSVKCTIWRSMWPSLAVSLSPVPTSNALYFIFIPARVRLPRPSGHRNLFRRRADRKRRLSETATGLQHGLSGRQLSTILRTWKSSKGPRGTLFRQELRRRPDFRFSRIGRTNDYEGYVRVGFGNYKRPGIRRRGQYSDYPGQTVGPQLPGRRRCAMAIRPTCRRVRTWTTRIIGPLAHRRADAPDGRYHELLPV